MAQSAQSHGAPSEHTLEPQAQYARAHDRFTTDGYGCAVVRKTKRDAQKVAAMRDTLHGRRMGDAWATHGRRMDEAWEKHGRRMDDALANHGNAWVTHGRRMGDAWVTHGRVDDCTQEAARTKNEKRGALEAFVNHKREQTRARRNGDRRGA